MLHFINQKMLVLHLGNSYLKPGLKLTSFRCLKWLPFLKYASVQGTGN